MLMKSLLIVFVLFVAPYEACDVNQGCEINMNDASVQTVAYSMETFSIKLMNAMFSDTRLEGNVTFSAPNIYVALFLLMIGSTDAAQTELVTALGLENADLSLLPPALVNIVTGLEVLSTSNIRSEEIAVENLSLGENLCIQSGLNIVPPFAELLQWLDGDSYSMDFAKDAAMATKKINQWIDNQTGKRTPITIPSPVDPSVKIFMATGGFMSAIWPENFFDPAQNTLGTFRSVSGKTNVVMMNAYKTLLFFDDMQTHAAIQIPFQNGRFILSLILPYANADPVQFVKSFTLDMWYNILNNSAEANILVQIPKFNLAWTNQLNEQLQGFNIKQIFQGATFSGMIEYAQGQLHVSSITHAAGLTINEIGLSMPDITPPSTTQTQLPAANNPPAFIVDRPCMFLVREFTSGIIVFSSFVRQL